MASSEKELEEQLMEVGNRLLHPPSSVDDLLTLLDKVENCLSRVEQSPSKSIQDSLCFSMKALVANELLRHSDMDVKVAVASCISEITRITAPDAPYDDEQMKEIFQLIVVAFEKLSDTSSRSYSKRISILETVAKVRSCVVMLDLECDALILEMFQNFLKSIRDNHSDNIFSSMETIMTLVLEESEDISSELLSLLLAYLKKENQDVLPIAQKLGEGVIEKSAAKLKPYLMQAVQSMDFSVNDYSKIVASICQETSDTIKHNGVNASGEHLMAREFAPEAACPGKVDPAVDRSPKSMVGNGTVQTGNDDSLVDPNSPKKLVRCRRVNQSKNADATRLAEPDCAVTVKVVKSETKAEQATKRRGRKPNSSLASAEASDNSRIDSDKDAVELPDRRKSRRKEVDSLHSEYPSIKEAAEPSEHDKVTETQLSMPPVSHNETVHVAPSSPSQSLPNGSRPKRGRRGPKKKRSMNPEANPDSPSLPKGVLLSVQVEDDAPPSANVILKEAEVTSESEAKPHGRSGKKALAGNTNEEKIPASRDVVSKKEADATSDSEAKPLRHSDEEVDAVNTNEEEASVKQQEGKKRRGKTISKKDVTEESGNKASGMPHSDKDLSENLVGSKIKIWWPKDQIFYEGVIESFDPVKKKHKILYVDGDKEILTLRKERWEFVGGGTALYGGQAPDLLSPDASSEMHRKKKPITNSDSSTKQAKADASSKSKSNVEATKSCGKSRDDVKLGSKSKDDTPKTVGRSKDDSGCKYNDDTRKTGSKLKDDADTPTGKSKDDTPKTITKSKGETGRGGGKSNGIAKGKSGSSKVSESEDIVNGKLSDSAKPQETKAKTGKKRRRRGVND